MADITDEQVTRALEAFSNGPSVCSTDHEAMRAALTAAAQAPQRAEPVQAGQVLTDAEIADIWDASHGEPILAKRLWRFADDLIRRVQAQQAVAWQPIETAPRDGSLFLCWVSAVRYGETDEGQQYQQDVSQVEFCQWRDQPGIPDCGWFDPCCGQIGDQQAVTHWMPLPPAPDVGVIAAPVQAQQAVACWTLRETLEKRETTTHGHLWFTDPQNDAWVALGVIAAPVRQDKEGA